MSKYCLVFQRKDPFGRVKFYQVEDSTQNVLLVKLQVKQKVLLYIHGRVSMETEFHAVRRRRYFSLQGKMYCMTAEVVPQNFSVLWFRENYRRFEHFVGRKPHKCHAEYLVESGKECWNFSSFETTTTKHIQYFISFQRIFRKPRRRRFLGTPTQWLLYVEDAKQKFFSSLFSFSWKQAAKICVEAGGNLPDFSSREELEVLLALTKLADLTDGLVFSEALYVGLSWRQKKNGSLVSSLFCAGCTGQPSLRHPS